MHIRLFPFPINVLSQPNTKSSIILFLYVQYTDAVRAYVQTFSILAVVRY